MKSIKVSQYSQTGDKLKDIEIKTRFENLDFNNDLIYQTVNSYLSNKRQIISNTKTRAEVAGGGRKPYKQKGTGSARTGSIRTPIHVGGGIVFGPTKDRNFKKSISKNLKKKALGIVLAKKNSDKEVISLETLSLKKPNTKELLKSVSKLPLKEGNTLIVTPVYDKNIYLSSRNIDGIDTKEAKDINCLDILNYSNIVLLDKANENISKLLA